MLRTHELVSIPEGAWVTPDYDLISTVQFLNRCTSTFEHLIYTTLAWRPGVFRPLVVAGLNFRICGATDVRNSLGSHNTRDSCSKTNFDAVEQSSKSPLNHENRDRSTTVKVRTASILGLKSFFVSFLVRAAKASDSRISTSTILDRSACRACKLRDVIPIIWRVRG